MHSIRSVRYMKLIYSNQWRLHLYYLIYAKMLFWINIYSQFCFYELISSVVLYLYLCSAHFYYTFIWHQLILPFFHFNYYNNFSIFLYLHIYGSLRFCIHFSIRSICSQIIVFTSILFLVFVASKYTVIQMAMFNSMNYKCIV